MTTCLGNCCSPGCRLWCLWWCLFVLSFFHARCLGWDLELNWVSFRGFSFLLFYFETYLYQYKEKMSRTRQQMNITEETMELSLIEIGYGEHSVRETYFTALLLKLDQKKLHEWKINRKSIIPFWDHVTQNAVYPCVRPFVWVTSA